MNEWNEIASTLDGGDLDCGSGLLLLIRKAMSEISEGEVLEIKSRESSVKEDLPAWCRMVKHEYLGARASEFDTSYFVRKGGQVDPKVERPVEHDLSAAAGYAWAARVRRVKNMEATVYARNHAFTIGQPASFKESDPHPSAVEYLLGALGGDLTNGFQICASQQGVQIDALEMKLSGRLGNVLVFLGVIGEVGDPGFTEITGTLYVSADADETTLQEIWQTTLLRSPIANTLKRGATLMIDLRVVD